MSHPPRYRDDDPYLQRLRALCLDLPGTSEKESHGRPTFRTRTAFAIFGGLVKGEDHWSTAHARALLIRPEAAEREALLADPRGFLPAYHGPAGWVGIDLETEGADPDWTEVAELVDASYRVTAPATLIAELDTRS